MRSCTEPHGRALAARGLTATACKPRARLELLDPAPLMAKTITEYLTVSLTAFVLEDLDGGGFVALCNVQYNLINNSDSFALRVCYWYELNSLCLEFRQLYMRYNRILAFTYLRQ